LALWRLIAHKKQLGYTQLGLLKKGRVFTPSVPGFPPKFKRETGEALKFQEIGPTPQILWSKIGPLE